ncbi:MAG: hypothetical protein AAGC45_02960 [Bacteroidota bacterium]
MMKSYAVILLLLLTSITTSCNSDDNDPISEVCDFLGVVDDNQINTVNPQTYVIQSVEVTGSCLQVELSSGGCDGNSWEVRLFGSSEVEASLPPKREIGIRLDNSELCEAFITKTYSFELTPFQVGGESIILILQDWEAQILYEY